MSAATDMFSEIIRKKEAEIELLRARLKAARNRLTHNIKGPGVTAMTIEAVESLLLICLNTEGVIFLEPYRVDHPYAARDKEGDLIVGVDGQINLTAIARAIVEASHD